MKDFSQALLNKIDTIVEQWVEAVRQDSKIETANYLPYKSVQDSMPKVLRAMATVLSQSQDSDIKTLVETTLEHGAVRAEQGYEAAEMAREYRILRSVIFSNLEENLLSGSPGEVIRAMRLIDSVIDEGLARGFKSYTDERLGELNLLQHQLALNNQELTRLVRSSQDNISHLAHELKSPLTSIIGYADLFLRQQRLNIEQTDTFTNLEHIERVLRSGRHLLHLINDALEISRYEAGKMKLRPAMIDVRSVINEVLEVMEPLASEKELKIVVNIERAPEQVFTDSLRLQQVVMNLVSNAIRYTEKSGKIEVNCEKLENEQWKIAVSDTGIGIAPEDQKHIFEPYFQVGEIATHVANSTGLGLAIVSRLVKLLQGTIKLVSQAGVGSTFTVFFPLKVETNS
ncbi:MAG TPA: sensor histidine kinase [Cyanobacteria bacterium UBA11049]|nr:sensor histidine kinase [Cyanobacteria bacterium UBA11049]